MRKGTVILILILGLTFLLRLYRIDNPLADWHSWRQVDTASVSREFVENGINLLYPTYHDISNVPSGMDNPHGYRFVEFPIYNGLHAVLFKYIGILTLETWGRLLTVFSAVLATFFIYGITRRYAGETAGLFAAFFYAVLPFSIYFGRVVLPDVLMTACWLGSIYFFAAWAKYPKNNKNILRVLYFVAALVFASVSLLLKPFAVFFLLPLIVIAYQEWGRKMLKMWELYFFALIAFLPLILWRAWILQAPEGIPQAGWLFNEGGIRFTGAFFYWIFAERLGKLILGYFGVGIFLVGLLELCKTSALKPIREGKGIIFVSLLMSSLLYITVVARGNIQHDYYQIPIIPSIVIILGIGASYLFNPAAAYNKIATRSVLALFIVFSVSFSWFYVRDYFNINNINVVTAGQAVDSQTPKDALVIALYGGDTTLLYHTKRRGWASFQNSIPELVEKGADYIVIVNPTDADRTGLGQEYEVVASENEYLLVKLSD